MEVMIPFPYRLTTGLAALAACFFFSSCKSTESAYADGNEVDYTGSGSVSNPNPRLPKEEYPFDSNGNYREDWAARGAGVSGVKDRPTDTALYTQNSDSDTPVRGPVNHPAYADNDTPARSTTFSSDSQSSSNRSTASNRSSSGSKKSSSSSSSSAQRRTSSGSRTVASNRSSSSKSKPKPKTTSKPVAKSTSVKVKSSDTLYGLAKKHGTTVAAIKSANGLKSDRIVDGKTLKIPKKK